MALCRPDPRGLRQEITREDLSSLHFPSRRTIETIRETREKQLHNRDVLNIRQDESEFNENMRHNQS